MPILWRLFHVMKMNSKGIRLTTGRTAARQKGFCCVGCGRAAEIVKRLCCPAKAIPNGGRERAREVEPADPPNRSPETIWLPSVCRFVPQ